MGASSSISASARVDGRSRGEVFPSKRTISGTGIPVSRDLLCRRRVVGRDLAGQPFQVGSHSRAILRRVSAKINSLLVCPACHADLAETPAALSCASCGRTYPVLDGVPRLQVAPSPPEDQRPRGTVRRALASIVALPFVYDVVQRLVGIETIYGRIRPLLGPTEGALVLDAGAGTGNLERLLPESARYIWLDPDPQKLRGFRANSQAPALIADATRIPFRDQSVDWVVSAFVSHHLDDDQLAQMLNELGRVMKDRLLFLDAVDAPARMSRLLWRYDRGRHPRSAERLIGELRGRFEIDSAEEFTILHRYLLVNARREPPRAQPSYHLWNQSWVESTT